MINGEKLLPPPKVYFFEHPINNDMALTQMVCLFWRANLIRFGEGNLQNSDCRRYAQNHNITSRYFGLVIYSSSNIAFFGPNHECVSQKWSTKWRHLFIVRCVAHLELDYSTRMRLCSSWLGCITGKAIVISRACYVSHCPYAQRSVSSRYPIRYEISIYRIHSFWIFTFDNTIRCQCRSLPML